MARLDAHRLVVDPPTGWDAEIYRRAPEAPGPLAPSSVDETPMPILHAANFALPAERGDYGGGAVETMGAGGVFVSLLEHGPEDVGTALFRGRGIPWPLTAADFSPETMQRTIAGKAGCQKFFEFQGRAFCLYVVVGSFRSRALLVREINKVLATIEIV